MTNPFNPAPQVSGTTGVDGTMKDKVVQVGALQIGGETLTESTLIQLNEAADSSDLLDQSNNDIFVGEPGDVQGLTVAIERTGSFFKLIFTLEAMRLYITDAGGTGSHGSQALFTFTDIPAFVHLSQQVYAEVTEAAATEFTADVDGTTAVLTNVSSFTDLYIGRSVTGTGIAASSEIIALDEAELTVTLSENTTVEDEAVALTATALTGAADGDFEIGVGTTAIAAAADGVLAAGNENIGADVDVVAEVVAAGGTDTTAEYVAADAVIYLNISGTAATIDVNGHVDVTGTIAVVGVMLE